MRKRKLVRPETLHSCAERYHDGVPLRKIVRDGELRISPPALLKLIKVLELEIENKSSVLFPPWVITAKHAVVECPDDYEFVGEFPKGEWQCKR